MRLPNSHLAIVPHAKLERYLLSTAHPVGGTKARFFLNRGFTVEHCEELSTALADLANANEITALQVTPFGTRYIVDGTLSTPDRTNPVVRTVWFIENGEDRPRFVTAYPG